MLLTKRLQAVADLVTPGNAVADVGCDHAYVSIYLASNDISTHLVAMDVNQGPIDRAQENILKYHCQDRIETRRSDGLEKLVSGEVDTILIAGMGGALAVQILMKRPELLASVRELILQPQSEIFKVRRMLTEQEFYITQENMVKEDGKFYTMMKAIPGAYIQEKEPYRLSKEEHFHYGRLLLENRHPVLEQFLQWDLGLNEGILEQLGSEMSESSRLRRSEIEERIKLNRNGLNYYQ